MSPSSNEDLLSATQTAGENGLGVNEPDAQLASLAAQGDVRAFERIMRRYNQRLFRLACGILGEASEAEDALQESYVRAFYSLAKFTGRGSLGAWLAQIVRNEAIDRVRARHSHSKFLALEADLNSDDDETLIEQHESPRSNSGSLARSLGRAHLLGA